jgi:hypothetical protein
LHFDRVQSALDLGEQLSCNRWFES